MKKSQLILIYFSSLFLNLRAQSQSETSKWFAGISAGYCFCTVNSSIKNALNDQHFNESFQDLIFGGTTSYPVTSFRPPVLFMAGVRIARYGSLYLIVGQLTSGNAEGYNGVSFVSFDYSLMQYTLGYQFSFPGTRFKLGIGPSLFNFKYTSNSGWANGPTTSLGIAGAAINLRMPLGAEKKLFGIEFSGQLNLAPDAKLGEVPNQGITFQATSVNMTNASLGITFAFRG